MLDFLKTRNTDQGVREFEANKDAVLLDVRSKEEYRHGHIPGSMNVPSAEIREIHSRITDKQTPIFTYCLSGSRSGMAASALKSLGYTNVKNIGGISSYSGSIEQGA